MALDELYQQAVLEHNRKPRNYHALADATHRADGLNAVCGDRITVYLRVADDALIEAASFTGEACAITTASASLMTEFLHRRPLAEALAGFEQFELLMADEISRSELLGEVNVLSSVRRFPTRIKSAKLAWHAMKAALEGRRSATTERR